jgi:hypothetical protein
LQEERNVKWLLIISIIMLWVVLYGFSLPYAPYYYTSRPWTILDHIFWWVSRIDVLCFIATITMATLFTAGFGNKNSIYKASIYLFIASMALLFIGVLSRLFSS